MLPSPSHREGFAAYASPSHSERYARRCLTAPAATSQDVVKRQWGPGAVPNSAASSFKGASIMLNADLSSDGIKALQDAKKSNPNGWFQVRPRSCPQSSSLGCTFFVRTRC